MQNRIYSVLNTRCIADIGKCKGHALACVCEAVSSSSQAWLLRNIFERLHSHSVSINSVSRFVVQDMLFISFSYPVLLISLPAWNDCFSRTLPWKPSFYSPRDRDKVFAFTKTASYQQESYGILAGF